MAALAAVVDGARAEAADAMEALDAERQARSEAEGRARQAAEQLAAALEVAAALRKERSEVGLLIPFANGMDSVFCSPVFSLVGVGASCAMRAN